MKHLGLAALLASFIGLNVHAAPVTVTGEKAQSFISALDLAGIKLAEVPDANGAVTTHKFEGSPKCEMATNDALDPSDAQFLLPTYTCTGIADLEGANARVVFDALSGLVGSESGMGKTWAAKDNLGCVIDLAQTDIDQRFTCTFDDGL